MSYVMVAVAGVNAFNQVQGGKWQKAQGDLQAMQADYQAKQEREAAAGMAEVIRRAGRRQMGAATAGYAAAGVRVGEGSAGEVERDIGQAVEQDAFQTLLTGNRRAAGLELEGKVARIGGKLAQSASYAQAANTLAQGYASGAKSWKTGDKYSYNNDASGEKFSSTGEMIRGRR